MGFPAPVSTTAEGGEPTGPVTVEVKVGQAPGAGTWGEESEGAGRCM